ncbi:putative glutathione peroxidase 1 [Triplophysa rosa]|uniref:Glutathione peroxidase n=2 Tax=Triplophysa rosa TaxID=992332 RepID=A0A9W7THD4_TRIRA|nr:putative glutathione peroxidase 1 [Triplophysa rosa]
MNALMKMYGDQNFVILGFPCNQFGLQSPEENHETLNVLRCVRPGGGYTPQFPIFSKIEVNGDDENPLYAFLKESLPFVNPVVGDIKKLHWSPIKVNDVRWNFEKFLIGADGVPYRRFDLRCPSEAVEKHIAMLVKGSHGS